MKKLTPMQAIRRNCIECVYDELSSGGAIQQVALCQIRRCPFYHLRPLPRSCKRDGEPDQQAIEVLRLQLDGRDRRRDRVESPAQAGF